MEQRTFYEDEHWFACLAAPPNLRGHAIIAGKSSGKCPRTLTAGILGGIHTALAEVARVLTVYYRPKHVLFASLRVKDPHIHLHMFPVTNEQEEEWRMRKGAGYDSGRFFEFLGDQERDSSSAHRFERERNGWTDEQERLAFADVLSREVAALTEIARMKG